MELRGGFFRCMPGRMLIDPGEVGLALDAQIALRWRFLSPMFSRLSGLPWQASRTRNRKQPSRATECELPWLAKPPRPLSPRNVGTHGAVSLVLGDAVRRLPDKLRPVVMGPASRFACAGRRRWVWSSLRAKRSNPWRIRNEAGLLRCARNDGCGDRTQTPSPDVQLHIGDAPLGAGPESITTDGGYGFRARCCASPRNDGVWVVWR